MLHYEWQPPPPLRERIRACLRQAVECIRDPWRDLPTGPDQPGNDPADWVLRVYRLLVHPPTPGELPLPQQYFERLRRDPAGELKKAGRWMGEFSCKAAAFAVEIATGALLLVVPILSPRSRFVRDWAGYASFYLAVIVLLLGCQLPLHLYATKELATTLGVKWHSQAGVSGAPVMVIDWVKKGSLMDKASLQPRDVIPMRPDALGRKIACATDDCEIPVWRNGNRGSVRVPPPELSAFTLSEEVYSCTSQAVRQIEEWVYPLPELAMRQVRLAGTRSLQPVPYRYWNEEPRENEKFKSLSD